MIQNRGELVMLCYGAQQLAASFRTVRGNTIQVAHDIPEHQYDHLPAEGARTVRQMLTHVALSPRLWIDMHSGGSTDITTFDFFSYGRRMRDAEASGRTKGEILELLSTEGEAFAAFLGGLSDAQLSEQVLGNGATGKVHKSRLEMLLGAKEHEMHHRAQLMLIERQLGLVPHLTRQMNERMAQMAAAAAAKTTA
jgi:uncharacterized damage-inducible protein DinB